MEGLSDLFLFSKNWCFAVVSRQKLPKQLIVLRLKFLLACLPFCIKVGIRGKSEVKKSRLFASPLTFSSINIVRRNPEHLTNIQNRSYVQNECDHDCRISSNNIVFVKKRMEQCTVILISTEIIAITQLYVWALVLTLLITDTRTSIHGRTRNSSY